MERQGHVMIHKNARLEEAKPSWVYPSPTGVQAPKGKGSLHKLLMREIQSLSEAELVALVLRTGEGKGGSALRQASRLWEAYERVEELAGAGLSEMARIGGFSEQKAASVLAAFELGRRVAKKPLHRGQRLSHPRQIYEAFGPRLRGAEQETFWLLLLDQKNRLLKEIHVATGTINHCPLYAADIFRPALRENALSIVLLHNHPSGDPEPSEDDKRITKKIQDLAGMIGLAVIDHIVVGDGRYVSFSERGLL